MKWLLMLLAFTFLQMFPSYGSNGADDNLEAECNKQIDALDAGVKSRIEAYYFNALYQRCYTATEEILRPAESGAGDWLRYFSDLLGGNNPSFDIRSGFAHTVISYDNYCLGRPGDGMYRRYRDGLASVWDAIVVVTKDVKSQTGEPEILPYCHGVIVGDRVFTARHCLSRGSQSVGTYNGKTAVLAELSLPSELTFRRLADPGIILKVSLDSPVTPKSYASNPLGFALAYLDDDLNRIPILDDDWIGLRILNPEIKRSALAIFTGRQSGIELLTVGANVNAWLAEAAQDPLAKFDTNLLSRSVRVDYSPACSNLINLGNHFYHDCQTERSLSGTPLFAFVPDDLPASNSNFHLELFGIQSSAVVGSPECGDRIGAAIPNRGVRIIY